MKLRNIILFTFLILSGCIESNTTLENTHQPNSSTSNNISHDKNLLYQPEKNPKKYSTVHNQPSNPIKPKSINNNESKASENSSKKESISSTGKDLSQQTAIQRNNSTLQPASNQSTHISTHIEQPTESTSNQYTINDQTHIEQPVISSTEDHSSSRDTQIKTHIPIPTNNQSNKKTTIAIEKGLKITEIYADKDFLKYYNPQNQAMYGSVKILGKSQDPKELPFKQYAPTYYQNGLIKREIYRLQEPDLEKYPHLTSIDLIDVTRFYTWDLYSSDRKQMTNCSSEHKVDGIKVYTVKTCTMIIPKGVKITGKAEEYIIYGKNNIYKNKKIRFKVTQQITESIQLNNHKTITDCTYRGEKKGQFCSFKDVNIISNDDGYFRDNYKGIISNIGIELLNEIQENPDKESNLASRSYWKNHYHHSSEKLIHLSQDLITLLKENNQEKSTIKDKMITVILDYIKAHNFHYGTKNDNKESYKAYDKLHNALIALNSHKDFLKPWIRSGVVQERYSLIIHGLFQNKYFSDKYSSVHLLKLLDILDFYHKSSESIRGVDVFGSAVHESLKMILFSADSINYTSTNIFYKEHYLELIRKITDLGNSNLIYWKKIPYRSTNGQLQHWDSENPQETEYHVLTSVIDALYRVHDAVKNQYNPLAFRNMDLTNTIDKAIASILTTHKLKNNSNPYGRKFSLAKNLIINKYLEDTGRNPKEICGQNIQKSSLLSGVCEHITQTKVMEAPYSCNNDGTGPIINLQKHPNLTGKQSLICQKLLNQEERFFNAFNLNKHTPVIDDHNNRLQVFIFSSPSEWKLLGSLFFKVPTNNGGIYMEGNPKNQKNTPKFYAYAADWFKEFYIWNLEHEYTHYLDGRYNQYGVYGHYPLNKTTWWTEGVAEYLAHGECFNRGLNTITNHIKQNSDIPNLETILKTDYTSGSDMIYSWSYSVHRFLNERKISPLVMNSKPNHSLWLSLADTLRNPNKSQAEAGYDELINDLITHHSEEYQHWVSTTLTSWWDVYKDSVCSKN